MAVAALQDRKDNTVEENKTKSIPRGRPVSGRVWKKVQTKRFSSVKYNGVKELCSTWEQKLEKKAKLKQLKELQNEIIEGRKKEKQDQRLRREEKEKRRKENELNATMVQSITKTHKLKGLSKKQLRNIKKTRMSKSGVVEYVDLYQK